jgi:hypothetical protein
MPEEELLTFDQVRREIAGKPACLLLGNGFSVAYDPVFKYDKLKDEVLERAFYGMDVEGIMLRIYSRPKYMLGRLKMGFIRAISAVHPEWTTDEKMRTCVTFLKCFSRIYTLSYDLLLYWAINSDDELKRKFFDGFGIQRDKRMDNWPNAGKTSTFYLHGSLLLHCFKPPGDIATCPRKPSECHIAKYIRPKSAASLNLTAIMPLIDILKNLSKTGQIPHFVSEGDPKQKYLRIQKCTYLKGCYEALKNEASNLVTYGVSFENDDHILEAIKSSKVKYCYIGMYDNEEALYQKAESLRSDSRIVKVYDAKTAKVWQ